MNATTRKWHNKLHRIADAADWLCFYCHEPVACWQCTPEVHREATRDHVVPKSQGGGNRYENLVLACRRCNEERGDTEFEVFREKQIDNTYFPNKTSNGLTHRIDVILPL